jgi:DNA-binding LacI/PurR family transcriptional regulator
MPTNRSHATESWHVSPHDRSEEFSLQVEEYREKIVELIGSLLEHPAPPTAIFAAQRGAIVSTLYALNRLGRKMPEEISLVYFDELPFLSVFGIELTAIRQPAFEIGYEAARIIIGRIEERLPQGNGVQAIRLKPRLIIGNTARTI